MNAPETAELKMLLRESYPLWIAVNARIEALYETDRVWNRPAKQWLYEYKYSRGGKTLCEMYVADGEMGVMIIFGKAEREKAEGVKDILQPETRAAYDEAQTYHDGKWVMFRPRDEAFLADLEILLRIKRRPNR